MYGSISLFPDMSLLGVVIPCSSLHPPRLVPKYTLPLSTSLHAFVLVRFGGLFDQKKKKASQTQPIQAEPIIAAHPPHDAELEELLFSAGGAAADVPLIRAEDLAEALAAAVTPAAAR
jgi:hypothetical protein